jgi:uncharacterized protein (DUF2235 family)
MTRNGGYRHLVYFIDGTWLWAGSGKTLDVYSNAYLLNTLLNADDETGHAQIVHYARGLGAGNGKAEKWFAGAFAYGIDELIADLYVNVCSNFERGDRIYIFGFSRGAVVARALTGLLSYGILKAHRIKSFTDVWNSYGNTGEILPAGKRKSPASSLKTAAESNKLVDDAFFSDRNPKIEFVGVFDTVCGGHGPSEVAQQLRLGSGVVQPNVKHAVHLLAIDETRDFFQPVYWTGLGTNPAGPVFRTKRTLEQIWMPGVHSDVGNTYDVRHLGNLALHTMIDRVIAKTDLSFDLNEARKLAVVPPAAGNIQIHNEFEGFPRFFGASPRPILNVPQTIHPFSKKLLNQNVNYKTDKDQSHYQLRAEFLGMPVAKEFLSGAFKSNC